MQILRWICGLIALLILAMATCARANAGTIVGNIQTATGSGVTNGTIGFTLSQSAVLSGTAWLVTQTSNCYTSTGGAVVGLPDPLVLPSTSTNTASGTLPAGTYYVQLWYVNVAGANSLAGPEQVVVLGAQGTVRVNAPALQPSAASGYAVAIGSTSGGETLQGTVTGWTQYQQSTALVTGTAIPSSNNSACQLAFSDTLVPTGTFYTVSLMNQNGSPIAGFPQTWCTYGGLTGTINVSNGAPSGNCSTAGVFYPTPLFGSGFTNQSVGGNFSVAGNLGVTGASTLTGALNAKGQATVANLNSVRFADQFTGATADVQITNAIAALPSAGGTVDARGYGATTVTIAATVNVGSASKTVTLLLDRATNFQCTIANGTTCWHLSEGSSIFPIGEVPSAATNGGFSVSNSANISNVLLIDNGSVGNFVIENLQILPNASATVTDSVVKIVNGAGAIRGLAIQGFANTVLLKITQTSGQFVGPINMDNLQINCNATAGCKPVLVQAVASGGVMLGIDFMGGSISHPGSGGLALVDLEGITGTDCSGIDFYGTQFESSNTTDIGILVNNCTGVVAHDISFTSAGSAGNACVKISGANTTGVTVTNLNNFAAWTNDINNTVTSRVIANANTRMKFYGFSFAGATNANDVVWDDATGNIVTIDTSGLKINRGVGADGSGFKHKRFGVTCSTTNVAGNICTTTESWTTAFADANYTVSCSGVGPTGTPSLGINATQVAASVTISVTAITAIISSYAAVDCIAVHD